MDPCVLMGRRSKFCYGSQVNKPAAALFESLTQLSFCLPGYLFENDSRLVPEKFEGEPAVAAPALHTQLGEIFSWVTAAIGGKP